MKHGKSHGEGVYRAKNGSVYEGAYREDMIHGHGTMRYVDGMVYVGKYSVTV